MGTNTNSEADLAALHLLLEDEEAFPQIERLSKEVNFFEVAGITEMEIKHSNVLSWLMEPQEPHELGDSFFRMLLGRYAKEACDYKDLEVKREWQHIDLLAFSSENKVLVCIENKVGTKEHDDQLNNYFNVINNTPRFENYEKHFLYLSPFGDTSSNPDVWEAISYRAIATYLEKALINCFVPETSRIIIEQYLTTIRRHVLKEETETTRLAKSIYRKHRRALDIILENRPDEIDDAATRIAQWLLDHDFSLKNKDKNHVRFGTKCLDEVIGYAKDRKSNYKDGYLSIFGVSIDEQEIYPYFSFWCEKNYRAELTPKVRFIRNMIASETGRKPDARIVDVSPLGDISYETMKVATMNDDDFNSMMDKMISAVHEFEQHIYELSQKEKQ